MMKLGCGYGAALFTSVEFLACCYVPITTSGRLCYPFVVGGSIWEACNDSDSLLNMRVVSKSSPYHYRCPSPASNR